MTQEERIVKFQQFMDQIPDIKLDIPYGFLTAPASTKFHGAYDGGLFDHSLATAVELLDLTEKLNLHWERPESPYIVGMFHDLCKADDYAKEMGEYIRNPYIIIPGHGEKSIIMLQRMIQLTYEEVACIRWHMGSYETDTKMWGYYDKAIRKYPNVLYTHMADMIASKIKGV